MSDSKPDKAIIITLAWPAEESEAKYLKSPGDTDIVDGVKTGLKRQIGYAAKSVFETRITVPHLKRFPDGYECRVILREDPGISDREIRRDAPRILEEACKRVIEGVRSGDMDKGLFDRLPIEVDARRDEHLVRKRLIEVRDITYNPEAYGQDRLPGLG